MTIYCLSDNPESSIDLLCIPGAGNGVTSFMQFSQVLPKHYRFRGLQPVGFEMNESPHETLSGIVDYYALCIAKSTDAPLDSALLVGHSFGGWVALELAKRLSNLDLATPKVLLIDVTPPADVFIKYTRLYNLNELLSVMELTCLEPLSITVTDLAEKSDAQQVRLIHAEMIRKRLIPKTCSLEHIDKMITMFLAYCDIEYAATAPYDLDCMLVNAGDDFLSFEQRTQNASRWSSLVPNLTQVSIPGNHVTMLSRPNIDSIVEILDRFSFN